MLVSYVIAPILIAVFLYLFSSNYYSRIVAIAAQAVFVGFAFFLFLESRQGELLEVVGGFRPILGITLKVDMLSASFILLTAILFLIVTIYGLKEERSKLFWLLMFIWEGLIIGIFMTRDFFNVFVLFEVASLVVVVLIMYVREKRSMYDGLIFLMLNTVAIQFYLFGVGYLYALTGALDMEIVAAALSEMDRSQLVLPYALIATAITFKCALVPLSSWLQKVQGIPRAPSAVSAILSALHIKCALFLFVRIQEVFAPIATSEFFLAVGLIAAVTSIMLAYSQTDIKLILAYSSTAQIGLIMVGLNAGGAYAQTGSLYHIINHAIFKAALFLGAGMIERMYKTRDISQIRGLMKRSPLLGITTSLSMLGIMGAPLFSGNISKYFMMTGINPLLYWVLVLINLGTIAIFIKYAAMLLGADTSDSSVRIDKNKQVSVGILGVMTLGMGVFGVRMIHFLFDADVSLSVFGYIEKTVVFALSVVVGLFLYRRVGEGNKVLGFFKRIDLNFRGMCASIGVFFLVMLAVLALGY